MKPCPCLPCRLFRARRKDRLLCVVWASAGIASILALLILTLTKL